MNITKVPDGEGFIEKKEFDDGTVFYYECIATGSYHRIYGPAVSYPDGYKSWWRHGKRHREDGPAIEFANGLKIYFLDNKEYSEEEYNIVVKLLFLI